LNWVASSVASTAKLFAVPRSRIVWMPVGMESWRNPRLAEHEHGEVRRRMGPHGGEAERGDDDAMQKASLRNMIGGLPSSR